MTPSTIETNAPQNRTSLHARPRELRAEEVSRQSRDWLLVGLSIVHGAALILVPSAPLIAIGQWWNANTIAHNFIHCPFLRSPFYNRLYSFYLTLVLGFPQDLWKERHLAHHRESPYRLRLTFPILLQTMLVLGLWALLLRKAPEFVWGVYAPGYLFGLVLCYVQGHFEHARGTTSHYGTLYNFLFFNDGYHVEHHRRPSRHWTHLSGDAASCTRTSRWPPVFRWIDIARLEGLERLALRSRVLQRMLLRSHERALRKHLPHIREARSVTIVGGGLFPRTAILLRRLLPDANLVIVDASPEHIETAREFIGNTVKFRCELFTGTADGADLVVIPLAFIGDREALYRNPPAEAVLIHDWIWKRRATSVTVSPWLLKRLNLVLRPHP